MKYETNHDSLLLAFESACSSFEKLDREMSSHVPLGKEDLAALAERYVDRVRVLNSGITAAEIGEMRTERVRLLGNKHLQINLVYRDRFLESIVSVVLVGHALVEAIINAAVAIALSRLGRSAEFAKFERQPIEMKWAEGPKLFLPDYDLDKSREPFTTLKALARYRKALSHPRITIHGDDEIEGILGNTSIDTRIRNGNISLLRRICRLPNDLHGEVLRQGLSKEFLPSWSMFLKPTRLNPSNTRDFTQLFK